MQLIQLESVRHQVQVGQPLGFGVRHGDGTLLLAQGQVIDSALKLQALFERGMWVDAGELTVKKVPGPAIADAPAGELPALWEQSMERARQTLSNLPPEAVDAAISEVAQPLMALVARDPDLAVFQVLRQHGNRHTQYGVNHAIHCSIAALLAARQLDWSAADAQRAVKAALTMNISMLELQGELACQTQALSPAQRELIRSHPERSVDMLQAGGVRDVQWLTAIAQHHETADGSGYPAQLSEPTRLAALLHRCDVYTAKLSPRQNRGALPADTAARDLFKAHPGDPAAAALIKTFGLYPPGCSVRLASGESGIVIRRGANAHTPCVAVLQDPQGQLPATPLQRNTAEPGYAIVAVLNDTKARLPMPVRNPAELVVA